MRIQLHIEADNSEASQVDALMNALTEVFEDARSKILSRVVSDELHRGGEYDRLICTFERPR